MKNTASKILLFTVLILLAGSSPQFAQQTSGGNSFDNLDEPLPVDPKITVGQFDNGLRYYIRENKKPEDRTELRLVVNAGSVLEEDNQRGLAHFVEHMAFNGTKNFAKQEIVDYLESIGMRFGPDINAYTSFDETVYMLQVPTDSVEAVKTAFQILEDWAHNVSFEPGEIDKERGVVIEEWRLGRGASARIRDQQFPILFKNSRYAERLPIGQKEIIENASYETIIQFYEDWYRPDLMAVIVVGDFDKSWIEELIRKHFFHLESKDDVPKRQVYPVPSHEETLFAIASDVEATRSNVSIYYKHDVSEEGTARGYRQLLLEALYNGMFNNRLGELLKRAEPPFLFGFSSEGRLIRSKEFYILGAAVKDNGVETGLDALLTEATRIKKYGFTATELEREKTELLRGIEKLYKERDKTESDEYAAEYTRNFLTDEPIPGIELEFELHKEFVPDIGLEEVNRLANQWITETNRVVTVSTPEKEEINVPTKQQLASVFSEVEQKDILPYEDIVSDEPLVAVPPKPGEIVEEKAIEEIGVTEWTLSNGVKVVMKPTDFKNDEVLFTAFSPGGHSLISNFNYIAAISAASIIEQGGLGQFDETELRKKLSGKIVSVSPWINELREGLSGSASPKDLETLFQLIHLYFTAPRKDSTAFLSFRSRIKGLIENRHASPNAAFRDTIQVTMSNYHFRSRPWSEALLDEMDLSTSFRIYQDRFADASDFTFFFVGNFEFETLRPFVRTYLASLPSFGREETWRNIGEDPPQGIIRKAVKKGVEPKSRVSIIFIGPFVWNRKNRHEMSSMTDVLEIKLREVLREDLGGTYGVGVWPATSRYPDEEYSINISFGCAPDRVQELTETVFVQIDSLKSFGTTEKYLSKVKESQRRTRETNLKKNSFWINTLRSYYFHRQDPRRILDYDQVIENLSLEDIKRAARKYFDETNYVQV
ncbi:insulinase family protein, partial [candidate division KSB1 bacterium]|nr:insulinase family protein [candidate division KSB1 bacterium]NIU92893.1 insulinase family protein [candidate division KSB1 bacterium]NIV96883.1 insulinase family protein [candidate division KSB1 bacterium]NIX70051.1 insulinase family protein [candidate division KSB1 bacterium]